MINLTIKYKDNFEILKDDKVVAELNYGSISHYHASGVLRGERFTLLPRARHANKFISGFLQFFLNGLGTRSSLVEQNGKEIAEIRSRYMRATRLILKSSNRLNTVYRFGNHWTLRPSKDKFTISDDAGEKLLTLRSTLNLKLSYKIEAEFHKDLEEDLAVELLIYGLFCLNISLFQQAIAL